MYFDLEMILIHAIAILSGLVFYGIASRDPRTDKASDASCSLCDSR
jgi:hypothetical protein